MIGTSAAGLKNEVVKNNVMRAIAFKQSVHKNSFLLDLYSKNLNYI